MKQIINRLVSFLILVSVAVAPTYAQHINDKWHFGNGAVIDFTYGIPQSSIESKMYSLKGCASVADEPTGNTLFYTNGINVWNKNNVVMPNGSGLTAGDSAYSTQGVVVVRYLGRDSQYVVFTTQESADTSGHIVRYSVIDMALDSGRGDVVPGQKNIFLTNKSTEKLTVAINAHANGYWIMTHRRETNEFVAFSFTASGLNTTPVVSKVGIIHTIGHHLWMTMPQRGR